MRLLLRCFSCIALFTSAGCGDDAAVTRVSLSVIYDPAWHVDELRMLVGGAPRLVEAAPRVRVVLPDVTAGTDVELSLQGLSGGEQVCAGTVHVVPRYHDEITASITLLEPACSDECMVGARECRGAAVVTCSLGRDGCAVWSEPVACGADTPTCAEGVCNAAACTDECATGTCEPDGFHPCEDFDSDPCLELGPATSCMSIDPCSVGSCTPDGCTSVAVSCTTPPASTCVGPSTLRTFASTGACLEGGTCSYEHVDRECDHCPDCDACAGVTCNSPPSACFVAAGACTAGTCSYAFADAAPCDDGNLCTTADTCASGECHGTPLTCSTPPPPICAGTHMLRTFASAGTCADGTCHYAPHDTPCALGCAHNACTPSVPPPPSGIVESGDVGGYVSIRVDASGAPHIAYYADRAGDLRYASWNGSAWSTELVDDGSGTDVGERPSLALDSTGTPHVSYYASSNEALVYAHRVGGTWMLQTVDSTGDEGMYSSLALDAADNPHIAYYHNISATSGDLKYASSAAGVWSIEVADGRSSDGGTHCSLAFDSAGHPAVSYHLYDLEDLVVARREGSTWTYETVDHVGAVGRYSSLAFDPSGAPSVSYYDSTNGALKLASRATGVWTLAVVDGGTSDVGEYTSLAFDATGAAHVTYHDYDHDTLDYASQGPAGWSIRTLAGPGAGDGTSLTFDAIGNAHVAYHDSAHGALAYAFVPAPS